MCRRTWNRKPFHDFKAAPAGDVPADCILGAEAYLGKYGGGFGFRFRRDLSSLGEIQLQIAGSARERTEARRLAGDVGRARAFKRVGLAPDRTHGRPPVQEYRLRLKRPPPNAARRCPPFKSSTATRSCSCGLFPWVALLRFAFG